LYDHAEGFRGPRKFFSSKEPDSAALHPGYELRARSDALKVLRAPFVFFACFVVNFF
jgi:hypothetical protein